MTSFRVLARAPSNIALVKYMGKLDPTLNLPANPSLSLTLTNLCTFVELRGVPSGGARLIPERPENAKGETPKLSQKGEEKFLRHFVRASDRASEILRERGLESRAEPLRDFEIRTSNTFPAAAGIASSASSFAALTLAAVAAQAARPEDFRARYIKDLTLRRALAALSREGSGSSCRSFEGPFVAWDGERVERVESGLPPLSDLVIVVSSSEKKVGSSEAHRRVISSPHWGGRAGRATHRYHELRSRIPRGEFAGMADVAEAEFRDMHQLFETSTPPFSYFAEGTSEVLDFLELETGLAFTMDAGPNVHVIVPQVDEEYWRRKISGRFPQFPLLADHEGIGAEIVTVEGVAL